MDRLSAMALLVKVTELGSMSAAARALNMPLTTVSRHIGELESALGVRLHHSGYHRRHSLSGFSILVYRQSDMGIKVQCNLW